MSDLITKAELVSWMDNWFEQHRYYHPHSKSDMIPYYEIKDILDRMPTVYLGGQVHASWIEPYDLSAQIKGEARCSACGYFVSAIELTNEMIRFTAGKTRFCPNCGARMDLEEATDASS